jgi:hypothetical protein
VHVSVITQNKLAQLHTDSSATFNPALTTAPPPSNRNAVCFPASLYICLNFPPTPAVPVRLLRSLHQYTVLTTTFCTFNISHRSAPLQATRLTQSYLPTPKSAVLPVPICLKLAAGGRQPRAILHTAVTQYGKKRQQSVSATAGAKTD